MLSPAFRERTLIAWVLWASAYLIANSLNNWLPTLYTTVYHLGVPEALRAASMTNVVQVGGIGLRHGDRPHRAQILADGRLRPWRSDACGAGARRHAERRWVIVFSTLSYGLIGSIAAAVYLYTPEIYPTRMRAIGTGVATSWLRIASAIGPTLVGFMLGKGGVDWYS